MCNLRGDQNKRMFVEQNIIFCSWHSILPNNAVERCCCGNPLEHEVFLFNYKSRNNTNIAGSFYCGASCARRFKEFAHIELLPLFNPFEIENIPNNNIINNSRNQEEIIGNPIVKRKPENQEFIQLTNLLFYFWFPNIEGYLYDKRNRFLEYPRFSPNHSEYEKLFRAIQSTCRNNRLTNLHELLAIKGQQLQRQFRNFTFPLTQQYFGEHFEENVL